MVVHCCPCNIFYRDDFSWREIVRKMRAWSPVWRNSTPKLIQGLRKLIPDEEITVIVNTAEDIMVSGSLVSPDVDTILYLFSGSLDTSKWWGIRNDTFHTNNALKKMGILKTHDGRCWQAACIFRTGSMNNGASLTEATRLLSGHLE